jgi:hypothetical protein
MSTMIDRLPPAWLTAQTRHNLRLRNIRPKSEFSKPQDVKAYVKEQQAITLQRPESFLGALDQIEQDLGTWGALVFGLLVASGDDISRGFDSFFMLVDKLRQETNDQGLFENNPDLFDRLAFILPWKDFYQYEQFHFGTGLYRARNYFLFEKSLKAKIGNCIVDAALIASLMLYAGFTVGEGRNSRYLHSSVYFPSPRHHDFCLWTVNHEKVGFGQRKFDSNDQFSGPMSFIATLIAFKYYHKMTSTLAPLTKGGEKGKSDYFGQILNELSVAEAINPFLSRIYVLKREIYRELQDKRKVEQMDQYVSAAKQFSVDPNSARAALAKGCEAPLLAALPDMTDAPEKCLLID